MLATATGLPTRLTLAALVRLVEAARRQLMLCSLALDEAEQLSKPLHLPMQHWKIRIARRHRAAAKAHVDAITKSLRDRQPLALPDLPNTRTWQLLIETITGIAASPWLAATALDRVDIATSQVSVHIQLTDITETLAICHGLSEESRADTGYADAAWIPE